MTNKHTRLVFGIGIFLVWEVGGAVCSFHPLETLHFVINLITLCDNPDVKIQELT